MSEYQYGAYGQLAASVLRNAHPSPAVAVYVGLAPVNLIRGYDVNETVDTPVKILNMGDAQRKLGYSSDWAKFSLCEAMTAHFANPYGNYGPIYMINTLDPSTMRKAQDTEVRLVFTGGKATLKSDTIILDTLMLEGLVEGADYSFAYDFANGAVQIRSLDPDDPIAGEVAGSYREVDAGTVAVEGIIGTDVDGQATGLQSISRLYSKYNVIPNLVLAPGWSQIPAVYNAMLKAATKVNGHWDAFVLADIPLSADGNSVGTIDKAIAWKRDKGYTSEFSKACWPMARGMDGQLYHLSTLTAANMLLVDAAHNGVPFESPANKPIPILGQYFGEAARGIAFDQQTGNRLPENGITTAVYWGGSWVLWGDHTAAYQFDTEIDPRGIFDVSIRMLLHITNRFQLEWGPSIDKPMDRQLKDTIINREQEKLDGWKSMGALIGDPAIVFLETENPLNDLMHGVFRWDIQVTPTPPLKAAIARVAYTDEGFASYYGGE